MLREYAYVQMLKMAKDINPSSSMIRPATQQKATLGREIWEASKESPNKLWSGIEDDLSKTRSNMAANLREKRKSKYGAIKFLAPTALSVGAIGLGIGDTLKTTLGGLPDFHLSKEDARFLLERGVSPTDLNKHNFSTIEHIRATGYDPVSKTKLGNPLKELTGRQVAMDVKKAVRSRTLGGKFLNSLTRLGRIFKK